MNIVPIWKSTYFEVPAPRVEFRVLCDGGEIFHGRAVKSPTEDKIRIWLNPICADFLNSQIAPEFLSATGDTCFPMEAYQEFSVEAYNELTGLWDTAMEVAFYNDTSYEERSTLNLSEPINGHSAEGQILPYSVFTGDTGTCCCPCRKMRRQRLEMVLDRLRRLLYREYPGCGSGRLRHDD